MLTAHRRLNPKKPGYLRGWEIIDDNMRVVKIVKTKREAIKIVKSQNVNIK